MKKTLSMTLVLAMLISAMLGIVSFADTTAAEPQLEVSQATLEFGNAVYLYIAVNYAEFGNSNGVTLKITNNKTGESVVLSPNTKITAPANCVAFKYDTLGAKNMGDELTLQAQKDGEACGEAKVFSILEYSLKASSLGDEKLAKLMDAMINYGMTAQKAYNHEGTYDLSKDYGLIVVSGSNEGKVLAEAGGSVTFTPVTSKTGANAGIYDYSLNKVADSGTFTVLAGAQKYIFLGDAQKTLVNIDLTTATLTGGGINYVNEGSANVNKAIYSNKTVTGSLEALSGKDGTNYAYAYVQTYYPGNSSKNTGKAFVDIYDKNNGGYMKFGSIGKQSYVLWASASAKTVAKAAAATAGGEFTLAITIGKDGVSSMPTGVMRVRGGTHANFLKVANNATNKTSTIVASVNGTSAKDVNLVTIQGEEGKQVYTTVYMVFNLNDNTIKYYNAEGEFITTLTNSNLPSAMGANSALIDWTQAESSNTVALFKQLKVFAGNIFE